MYHFQMPHRRNQDECLGIARHKIKEKGVFMLQITPRFRFMNLFIDNRPRAFAKIQGNEDYPNLQGFVFFYEVPNGGVLIEAEIFGLPVLKASNAPVFYGFHIHEKGDCSDQFSNAGGHYNPRQTPHPHHAGDMPPLRSVDGYAWLAFYGDELELSDLVGKSVILHRNADDFTTQPSGNSGAMIGCGVIELM